MSEPIKFETTRGTRISEKLLTFALFFLATPMLALLSTLLSLIPINLGMPQIVAGIVALIFPLIIIHYAWRKMIERLRFCVVLYDGNIEIGRGLSRSALAYEDVDMIAIGVGEAPFVQIDGPRSRSKVYLTRQNAMDCAEALRIRCRSAVFVDAAGTEYLPSESCRPLRNLLLVERRCLMLAFGLAAMVPIALAITAGGVFVIYQWSQGIPNSSRVSVGMLLGGFVSPFIAIKAWQNFIRAKDAREARRALIEKGVTDISQQVR